MSVNAHDRPAARWRIAHAEPWYGVAGTEIATLRMIQALDPSEFEHVVFCRNGRRHVRAFFESAGLPTGTWDPLYPELNRAGIFFAAAWRFARELRRWKVDLVHSSDFFGVYVSALSGWLAGVPVICHVRNPFPLVISRERALLRLVSRLVFVSRDARKAFGDQRAADRAGVVVYDGIDVKRLDLDGARLAVRRELGIAARAPVVGMVARIARQKDYATLARAAARVAAVLPDVRFLIVGDNETDEHRDYYREVRRMVSAAGVEAHFTFAGFRRDVPSLLCAMDVFVLCTNFEGFGLALIEAMAQRVPVVGTAVGGILEIIDDGRTGLLHRHADDEHLALQLLSLLRDPARAHALAAAAREAVVARFSQQALAAEMAEVYRELLPEPHRPRLTRLLHPRGRPRHASGASSHAA